MLSIIDGIIDNGVIKEIFNKDIRHRVKVKDRDAFEVVRNFVINNFASPMSINGIVSVLKKMEHQQQK